MRIAAAATQSIARLSRGMPPAAVGTQRVH